MAYPFRDIVPVPFPVTLQLAVNGQVNPSFKDKADLGGMGVFRQVNIFFKMHEDHLMGV